MKKITNVEKLNIEKSGKNPLKSNIPNPMLKAQLFNLKNERVGDIEIPEKIFGAAWKPILVTQVLNAIAANSRRPWAHAKGRGEVRGGGKKPWRQKGTGRARHGSIRSPLWIGGGKAHGPTKERDYSQKINKKMKRAAGLSALSKKFKDNEIMFFDSLNIAEPKTKALFSALKPILGLRKAAKKIDVLFIPSPESKNIFRASRNLVKAKTVAATNVSVADILGYKRIFMDKSAVEILNRQWSRNK